MSEHLDPKTKDNLWYAWAPDLALIHGQSKEDEWLLNGFGQREDTDDDGAVIEYQEGLFIEGKFM